MIVKCDQCQTRFRIADEKVTEKGVKVRCTKCQHTFRVARAPAEAPPPAPELPPLPGDDPFAEFGAPVAPSFDESTRPGVFIEGLMASRPADPVEPSFDAQRHLPEQAFNSATHLGPSPTSGFPVPADLGDVDLGFPEPTTKAGPDYVLQALARSSAPLPPPTLGAPAEQPPPLAPTPATDLFGDLTPEATVPPPLNAAPPPPPGEMFADLPSELSPPPPPAAVRQLDAEEHALFDFPEPTPVTSLPPDFGLAPSPSSEASPGSPPAPPAPTDEAPLAVPGRDRGGGLRRVGVWVLNSVLAAALVTGGAAVLLAYLDGGSLDPRALSAERVRAMLVPRQLLRTQDVSNGLYETAAGRPVLYIRGEVVNGTHHPARARVRVEIVEDHQVVRAVEGFAGALPPLEDLYQVASPSDLERLLAGLEAQAVDLAPGGRAPFLLAFYEYPPDLQGFRLQVRVREAEAAPTAAR